MGDAEVEGFSQQRALGVKRLDVAETMPQSQRQRGQAQATFTAITVLHTLIAAGVRVPGHDVSFLIDEFFETMFSF
jgi:hypothetical protein